MSSRIDTRGPSPSDNGRPLVQSPDPADQPPACVTDRRGARAGCRHASHPHRPRHRPAASPPPLSVAAPPPPPNCIPHSPTTPPAPGSTSSPYCPSPPSLANRRQTAADARRLRWIAGGCDGAAAPLWLSRAGLVCTADFVRPPGAKCGRVASQLGSQLGHRRRAGALSRIGLCAGVARSG